MAFQEQQSGSTQEFLEVLSRRKWQIILPTLLILSLGIAWAEFVPRKYEVQTIVELRSTGLVENEGTDGKAMLRSVQGSAEQQIRARNPIRDVIEKLQWDDYLSISGSDRASYSKQLRTEYVDRVKERLVVQVKGGGKDNPSSFLYLRYSDTNAQRAEQFLNELRNQYIINVVERERNRAREERDSLQDLMNQKDQTYQDSERELADLKRQYQLSYTQPERNRGLSRDEDPTFQQLTRAEASLSQALQDLEVHQEVVADLKARFANEPEQRQKLKTDGDDLTQVQLLEIDEAILAEKQLQVGIRPPHSRYQKAEAEIARLESLRRDLEAQLDSGVAQVEYVENTERERLYQELQQHETKVVQFQATVSTLRREIESLKIKRDTNLEAQRRINELDNLVAQNRESFNKVLQAYQDQRTFVERITGSEGNPFVVLEVAEAPRRPTSPNPWVIRILALMLGLGVGFGTALLGEYGKSGYRTIQDAGRGLSVPVLGAVNGIVTKGEARRRTMQRIAVGASSLVLIGMVLWITWAWRVKPNLLAPQVVQAIEDLRSQFR